MNPSSLRVPRPPGRIRAALAALALGAGLISTGAFANEDTRTPESPPRADATADSSESLWSLQPLSAPPLPEVHNTRWPITPVDRFILARLEKANLEPSPSADRRTLLRRVSYNLTGLPPSPEELDAFLADLREDAYERAVDRLLDSPRYGERWARHWLDTVHFAETHGHDQDRIRTNAWPYRDYVIRSFNEDKPFARFAMEQVAGDALHPGDPDASVATGFLAAGPWDESSLRDIREDTVDREIARYLDRDDVVTTVMQTFTSMTVHCARCHDHKFDPISQREYYSLQSVFSGIDKANRAYDRDPALHARRRNLVGTLSALQRRDPELESRFKSPSFQRDLAAWENNLAHRTASWTILRPDRAASANGSTLAVQPDGSVLSEGPRPDKDTYTLTFRSDLRGVTALRLEVMLDDSLPHRGPGRQDNGNLHLTRLTATARPADKTSEPVRVPLANPQADFNQSGWEIGKALDDDPATAWGVYPEIGKPHTAVFELEQDAGFERGTEWTVTLDQLHGGGHLIGRARVSLSSAPRPIRLPGVPDPIAAILNTDPAGRTGDQSTVLARYYLEESTRQDLAALPPPSLVYAGTSEFVADGSFKPARGPREVRVLARGDIGKPGDAAEPGALDCVQPPPWHLDPAQASDEGARRAALARWLTDKNNPLTWRSAVNRIWHYHFGRGIVETPNDFGRMGGAPSHPELLDWMAVWFRDQGGSFKRLHRLLVTSAVYRQTSSPSPIPHPYSTKPDPLHPGQAADPDNRLLWRMHRARLDAEQVRDSVLLASGQMDWTMGGPSARHFHASPGIHVTPKVDYDAFDVDSPAARRRAIYRFLFRTLPDPMMDTLDCADGSQWTPVRGESITAAQALTLLNHPFLVTQSGHMAARIKSMEDQLEARIATAYRLALGRAPLDEEKRALIDYTANHGLANLCRVLLNSNEFMFVD